MSLVEFSRVEGLPDGPCRHLLSLNPHRPAVFRANRQFREMKSPVRIGLDDVNLRAGMSRCSSATTGATDGKDDETNRS